MLAIAYDLVEMLTHVLDNTVQWNIDMSLDFTLLIAFKLLNLKWLKFLPSSSKHQVEEYKQS